MPDRVHTNEIGIPGSGTKCQYLKKAFQVNRRYLRTALFKLFSLEPWGSLGILSNTDSGIGECGGYSLSTYCLQPLFSLEQVRHQCRILFEESSAKKKKKNVVTVFLWQVKGYPGICP